MSNITRERRVGPDGKETFVTSFELKPEGHRPVNDDAVEDIDAVLRRAGNVLHAFDPARIVNFASGGPPVWSVAMVPVTVPKPYTLFLTYGFSHIVSPERSREGVHHEYAIAVAPHPGNTSVWAPALLRQLARYVLTSGKDLRVGDIMPCQMPITHVPFQPGDRGMMPNTDKDAVLVCTDPVIPHIDTRKGRVEIRRIVGITTEDLNETYGPTPAESRSLICFGRDELMLTSL